MCLVVGQLTLGGLEKQAYLLATGLDRGRFDVTVVSMAPGGRWAGSLREAGVSVQELQRRGHLDWRRLLGMLRIFRRDRPHLVYSFNYEANAYARLAGLLAGVPILVTGERGVYFKRHMILLERLLVRFTECVICNAEAIRGDLIRRVGLPEEKVMTIRNAVAIPPSAPPGHVGAARTALGAREGDVVVGTIGHLAAIKNLAMLVRAAALCRSSPFALRFVVIGGGPDENAVRAAIRSEGLEDRFTLLGEREDARDLLSGFDIFVLTSLAEGLPNTLMEAMAAELPCVSTDVGGCRELVEDGVTGHLVASGDAIGLAARILELAGDPQRRAAMGRAGRIRIAAGYGVGRLVSEVEAVFERLLAAAGTRARGRRLQADLAEAR